MKHHHCIAILVSLFCIFPTMAQRRYHEVLDAVTAEGSSLVRLEMQREAQRYEAGSESILEGPQVEYGHLWGFPDAIGNRWDLSITQTIPFPSTWWHTSKVRRMTTDKAELDYQVARTDLMLTVQQICSELVYYNAVVKLYTRCADNAGLIAENYTRRLSMGDCNILEYNRAIINKTTADERLVRTRAEREILFSKLQTLVPGVASFEEDHFEPVCLPKDFDVWFDTIRKVHPTIALLDTETLIAEEEVKVSQSQWLPNITVGYASESVTNEAFRGITIGAELPLWNNGRRVKAARAKHMVQQTEAMWTAQQIERRYRALYQNAVELQNSLNRLRQVFDDHNSTMLLQKALDAGEITLEQYLVNVETYNDAAISILEVEHELESIYIQLFSYKL